MPRNIGRDGRHEARDVAQLGVGVVESRDDQRDHLEPEAQAVQTLDRLEHCAQHAAQLPVVLVVEALQIDLVEVDPGTQVVEHLGRGVAVRDVRADEAAPLGLAEDLDGPLARDQGLVVGGGEDPGVLALGQVDDLCGRHLLGRHAHHRVAQRLGGQRVLTVLHRTEASQVGVLALDLEVVDVSVEGLQRD